MPASPKQHSHAPEPLGVPTRRAAIRLLDAVLRRGESLEAALPAATRMVHGPDRGLAHAIAAETLRRLPDLDALIDGATERVLPDDAKARTALRIALVQALVLGTPPHAAIATVLPLVDGGPRKLVHGVFGTLMRGGLLLPEVPSLPADVEARWATAWGEEMVADAERAIAAPPPLDLTLADPDVTEAWRERLGGESVAPGHLRLADHAPVAEMEGYAEGAWWVQDVAASIPARLIGAGDGAHVLDLCAAPGGKTMQLAAAGWRVTAVDSSAGRIKRLRENLHRTRLKAEVVRADVLDWAPDEPADAVLLDAPCSATGIFRRHPDVLHRVRPAVVEELAGLQRRLLARAADWVKPGGTLVYATCSLEPEEGERQLERFLRARSDYALVPADPQVVPATEGAVRTLPGMLAGGNDGFFVARLVRG
ncbi:RsmB/NOP family class I SAM-dependent RNA methyltransferase [Sphingomonas rubra]|uniref:16S rRNA (Cytosine967-C5)-methyltransferase n=1 Tax=Sphingomonas rubra TaxID=634430 RepID=A0A1I5TTQ9_9SPHN|nr:transcription antitermination factor NusB [Sphingomonas rubra]SFP86450.1 16S rRNA (cytosine967-C5)-methyltransferase [Sphingomonas rubra]